MLERSSRDIDNFEDLTDGAVTNEEFKEAYSKRDIEVLKVSRPTLMFNIINDILVKLMKFKMASVQVESIQLTINYYPYILSYTEKRNHIRMH